MKPQLDPFRPIDPPPGGLTRLRARLDERARRERPARPLVWLAPAVAGAAVAVALLVPRGEPVNPLLTALAKSGSPAAIELGLARAPQAPVSVPERGAGTVAVAPISRSGEVAFYLVETREAGRAETDRPAR